MAAATLGYEPSLEKFLKSLKGWNLDLTVANLVSWMKYRRIKGSEDLAVATAHCLLQVVAKSKWQDVDTLIYEVSRVGNVLVRALPHELVIGNVVRRVLGLIRDEAAEDRNEGAPSETPSEGQMTPIDAPVVLPSWPASGTNGPSPRTPTRPGLVGGPSSATIPRSLSHLLSSVSISDTDGASSPFNGSGASTPLHRGGISSTQLHALKSEIIDGIEEIMDEISQVDDQIGAMAEIQIRPGDHILVHQPSRTVERFIVRAAAKRKFTVLLAAQPSPRSATADAAASDPNLIFRKKLAAAGIKVVSLYCGGVMAYMSRINRVIMGASAITADGGAVSDAGAAAIARAAKANGVSVIVLAGIYKLSPTTPYHEDEVIEWANPAKYVAYSDGPAVQACLVKTVEKEFIPGRLIDTYVTNLGTHSAQHLSGLIADHYKEEDVDLHLWKLKYP